jgi:hypothetical protein
MKTLLRAVFAVAVTAALAAAVAVPSDAAPRHARAARSVAGSFDGEWSVSISTAYGNCNSYRAALRIVGGRVQSASGDFNASGYVNRSGGISVAVSSGSGSAVGSGRLRGSQGAGRWRSSSGECGGTWYATRRGY